MPSWEASTAASEEMDWAVHNTHIRAHLERAHNWFKKNADRNRTERHFQAGDQVLLKLQPYA